MLLKGWDKEKGLKKAYWIRIFLLFSLENKKFFSTNNHLKTGGCPLSH